RGARHSLLLQCILETADSVLNLAFDLVGLAVGLQLGIAYRLADGLLDRALDLLRRSRDPIPIHDYVTPTMDISSVHRGDRIGAGPAAVDSESTQPHSPPSKMVVGRIRGW